MEKGSHNKINTVFELSAGGVLFKIVRGKIMVVLIAVKDGTVWTLPKGLLEKGEKAEEAAVREVLEETGCIGKVITFIDRINLWYYSTENNKKVRHHKIVYYYLLKYIKGDTRKHDYEVSDARWFDIESAIETVYYKKDKEILKKARELLNESTDIHIS